MTKEEEKKLSLANQLCFALYVCSKEIIRKYNPLLEPLGLTYTQYIVMLVLWEDKKCNVTELGKKLFLDNGTLTPLLKKMEQLGYLSRKRSHKDERMVLISLTEKGLSMKEKCIDIPDHISEKLDIDIEKVKMLRSMLYDVMKKISE